MTDIAHHLTRTHSAPAREFFNPIGRAAQAVARRVKALSAQIAARRSTRRTTAELADLSEMQRRDIGLTEDVILNEPWLGDINQVRGYALNYQLGGPYGR